MASSVRHTVGSPRVTRETIVALFDDSLDAEQALMALRKMTGAPEQISLVVRDRATEDQNALESTGALARVLVATALDAVGGWLQGRASLIVPRRGTYLVAGPIGAALTSMDPARRGRRETGFSGGLPGAGSGPTGATTAAPAPDRNARVAGVPGQPVEPESDGLIVTLVEFGFGDDEAEYIERRLEAGAALIAITSNDARRLNQSRRLFADHSAVHIGRADTDEYLASEVTAMLASAAHAAAGSDIVVADAVAPLRHLCDAGADAVGPPHPVCGEDVVDEEGHHLGTVEELLGDPDVPDPDGAPTVRYVVIASGGVVFGLGKRHVPVPAALCDLAVRPVRVARHRDALDGAPVLAIGRAFSRREEEAICTFFEIPCYWLAT